MSLSNASLLAKLGFVAIALGLILLILGYLSIKTNRRVNHKWFMLSAVFIDAIFLVLYVTRYLSEGNAHFKGSHNLFLYVYAPILIVHVSTAIISIWFVLRQVKSGLQGEEYTNDSKLILKQPHRDAHRKYGLIAVYIWGASFVGGIIVFTLLYLI